MAQPDIKEPSSRDELIKLACSVVPVSKSEYGEKLDSYLQSRINEVREQASDELFKALRDVWANPPKEFVEQGANEVHWHRNTLLETLDTLREEWFKMLKDGRWDESSQTSEAQDE